MRFPPCPRAFFQGAYARRRLSSRPKGKRDEKRVESGRESPSQVKRAISLVFTLVSLRWRWRCWDAEGYFGGLALTNRRLNETSGKGNNQPSSANGETTVGDQFIYF